MKEHKIITPYFRSENSDFLLANGDAFDLLQRFDFKFDTIFADPPYFLSDGGISCQAGQVVSVDKGKWDKSRSHSEIMHFNYEWLKLCRDKLTPSGTIWISGTYHNIFSVANCLVELGYKILNIITWQKTNPPPNITRRFFTHSTEFVIWARRSPSVPHYFDYSLMKKLNQGKQMTDVWKLPAIGVWEKEHGKHPTQKPLRLLVRLILASTRQGDWVLDPFCGSGTTGIAANLCGRRFVGIDAEKMYCDLAVARRLDLDNNEMRLKLMRYINDLDFMNADEVLEVSETSTSYGLLPF